jgi:hypothetical protein
MTYDLYFFNTLVAKIENASIEFLNCHGNYVLDADFLASDSRLKDFVDYTIGVAPLLAAEKFDEINWDEDEKWAEFSDTEDWYLMDETGKKSPILVPLFNNKTDITWRYNVDFD